MKVAEPRFSLGDAVPAAGTADLLGPIMTPNEASYRLDRLRDAWNQLYNDVWRGLTPNPDVDPVTAETVAQRYQAWRLWYEGWLDKPWDVIDLHLGSPFARGLADWTEVYGHLREQVLAGSSGAPTTWAPPLSPIHRRDLAPRWLWPAAVGGTFALGALWVFLRRPVRPRQVAPAQ